jgi:DNA mismatch endonuclease (patch repair protein)
VKTAKGERCIRSRAPVATSATVRRVMQANVGRETCIEKRLRSAVHIAGLRFRKDAVAVPGISCKADLVFPAARVCVFVDGCFWHGCRLHFRVPQSNASWWHEKIAETIGRDRRQSKVLRRYGWKVLRFWEHELADDNISLAVAKIQRAVRLRSMSLSKGETGETKAKQDTHTLLRRRWARQGPINER